MLEALAHPGIPRVFECGVLGDRRPWAAIEYVDGTTLGAQLATGPLALTDLTVAIRDVADLLAHVHARGVVHRRLAADTIVCTPERAFAHCVRDWSDALTLDTAAHVAVDARDDVHALGVIAFRALTGMFPAPRLTAIDRCPAAPIELTCVIDKMLAEDPAMRPTAHEIRDRARWLAATLLPVAFTPHLAIEEPQLTVRFSKRS